MIRKATKLDIPEIAAIQAVTMPEPYSNNMWLKLLKNTFLVAEQEGEVIGYIVATKKGHIPSIAVSPSVQRQGIGKQLLEKIFTDVKAVRFRIELRESNKNIIEFYKQFGFTVTKEVEKGYSNGEKMYIMVKDAPLTTDTPGAFNPRHDCEEEARKTIKEHHPDYDDEKIDKIAKETCKETAEEEPEEALHDVEGVTECKSCGKMIKADDGVKFELEVRNRVHASADFIENASNNLKKASNTGKGLSGDYYNKSREIPKFWKQLDKIVKELKKF